MKGSPWPSERTTTVFPIATMRDTDTIGLRTGIVFNSTLNGAPCWKSKTQFVFAIALTVCPEAVYYSSLSPGCSGSSLTPATTWLGMALTLDPLSMSKSNRS